jgi:hypothetical protein
VAELLGAGDLEGARVATEALSRLLGPGASTAGTGSVIDLEERRRRDGGSGST